MAVIPRIINTLERLHPRATTNNGLSDGAIAGIVLGSVFGLLFILSIFWMWRFGSGIVTTAKRLSRTATDKVEKVHAHVNDLYTAGRDRQHQSPKLDDKAHYQDPDVEHWETSDQWHERAFCITPSEGTLRIPSSSAQHRSNTSRPPVNEKPAVVDAKQVLGIDDASYLNALPTQSGQTLNVAVAPVYPSLRPHASGGNFSPSSSLDLKEKDGLLVSERTVVENPGTPYIGDHATLARRNTSDGVDPRDVELGPNPVMFAHLLAPRGQDSTEPLPTYCPGRAMNVTTTLTRATAHGEPLGENGSEYSGTNYSEPYPLATNMIDSSDCTVDLRPGEYTCLDNELRLPLSSFEEYTPENYFPASAESQEPSVDKGKRPCVASVGTVKLINYVASLQQDVSFQDQYPRDIFPAALAVFLQSVTGSSTNYSNEVSSPDYSPPVESVRIVDSTPPSVPDTDDKDLPYPCPSCGLRFRTPGLRRTHQYRKHDLRYSCDICEAKFGLRADLKRHKRNVHRAEVHISSSKLFRCPNIGCTAPGKEYARKDNFIRHVERCKKAISKAAETHRISCTDS